MEAIQSVSALPMDYLLRATARAEARHFWFRGFRAFVASPGPTPRSAIGPTPDCSTAAAAPAPISSSWRDSGSALRLRPVGGRAHVSPVVRDAGPWRAPRSRPTPFRARPSISSPRSTCSTRSTTSTNGCGRGNVPSAQAGRLRHRQRRRDAEPDRRPFGAQPRAAPLYPGSLRPLLERAGFTIERLTYTNATLFLPLAIVRGLSSLAGSRRGSRRATRRSPCRAAPVNAALTVLLWLESVWLRVVDNPFGSSLLCLARKPDGGAGLR